MNSLIFFKKIATEKKNLNPLFIRYCTEIYLVIEVYINLMKKVYTNSDARKSTDVGGD